MFKGVLFFAFIATASAGNLYWIGGTTNFSDFNNWQNRYVPGANGTACSTTFGSASMNIISQLSVANYFVGQVLHLPSNGALRLTSDGTVLTFTDFGASTCPGQDAVWTGGSVLTQSNDFYCHQNWINDAGLTPTSPPCDQDFAYFDSYSAYHVGVSSTVNMIAIRQLQLGSVVVTSNTTQQLSLVEPQVDLLGAPGTVYVGSSAFTAVCKPLGQANLQTAGCYCYSSCPTSQMLVDQQTQTANAAAAAAALLLAQLNTYYVRPISGTMNAASLYLTNAQLQALVVPANYAVIQAALRANLLDLPAASITSISVTYDSGSSNVVFTANINATLQNLLPAGSSSTTVPSSITWTSTVASIPVAATRIQFISQTTLASTLLSLLAESLVQQVNTSIASQPPATQTVLTTISNINALNLSAIIAAGLATPCLSSCSDVASCDACKSSVTSALIGAGLDATTAATLADQLVAAKEANIPGWSSTSSTITSTTSQIQNAITTTDQASQATPQTFSVNSPNFYIGRSRLLSDQLLATNALNIHSFQASLAKAAVLQNILAAWNMQAQFVNTVPTGARRRRAVVQTASAVQVTFSYNISCLPSNTACQSTLSPTSTLYLALQAAFETAMNSYVAKPIQCQYPGYAQFNYTCLQLAGRDACVPVYTNTTSVPTARAAAYDAVFAITKCGFQPAYPNGTCLDTNYVPLASDTATSVSSALDCTSSSATLAPSPSTTTVTATANPAFTTTTTTAGPGATAASSSGGGGGLGMIAGAAGGGVAIILIVILVVLLRRKRKDAPKKNADDRTVVAFENPMYDDPTAGGVGGAPIYDAAARGDGEGLYDEPAFNANLQKANPVYESTENLADGGAYSMMDENPTKGDGYLDVAPKGAEDVGYLDGAEDKPAEDVGYLGAPSEDVGYLGNE